MKRPTPKSVIAELSTLSEPSTVIDAVIYFELLGNKRQDSVCKKCGNLGWIINVPRYTGNIQETLKLIPDGWEWLVRSDSKESPLVTGFANVYRRQDYGKKNMTVLGMDKGVVTKEIRQKYRLWSASNYASSPAIALCMAALKARFNVGVTLTDSGRPVPSGTFVSKELDQFMDIVIKNIAKSARAAKGKK